MTPQTAGSSEQTARTGRLERGALQAVLKRDRAVVLGGLLVLCAIAWAYTVGTAAGMDAGGMAPSHDIGMPHTHGWGAGELAALFTMWAVMMVAMMVPSATPVILLVTGVYRRRAEAAAEGGSGSYRSPAGLTGIFLLGYLVVWISYAAFAASAQLALHNEALLSPRMASASPILGGTLLLAAGVFQWTPLKAACLAHCRSPLHFLTTEWREGKGGALFMGLKHGAYCVGCCWLLMGLLFVAGVMNLVWVAAIAALVLVEKVAPAGRRMGQAVGVALIAWGGWVLHSAVG